MKDTQVKYQIYLDLNNKNKKEQLNIFNEVTSLTMSLLDYATFQTAKRLYNKEFGNCIIITKIGNDIEEELIKAFCNTLKLAFNQESVLYIKEDVREVIFC